MNYTPQPPPPPPATSSWYADDPHAYLPPPEPDAQQRHSRRRPIGIVAAVVLVLIGGAAVYLVTNGDASKPAVASKQLLPASTDAAWSVDFDGSASASSDGESVYVASVEDSDVTITALSAASGEERWAVDLKDATYASARYATAAGVLVDSYDDTDSSNSTIRLLAAADGEELWSVDSDDAYAWQQDGRIYLRSEIQDDSGGIAELQLIDMATGKKGKRVKADRTVTFAGERALVWDSDEVQIVDAQTLDDVGDAIGVDDATSAIALAGDRLLVAEDNEIAVLGLDGKELWSAESPVGYVYTMTVQSGIVIIGGEDGVAAVTMATDSFEELWNEDGFVYDQGSAAGLVAITDDDELVFVDERSGETLANVDGVWDGDYGPWTVYDNGVIVQSYDADYTTRTDEAFALPTGDAMWELDDTWLTIGDRWMIGNEQDDNDVTISFYR